MLFDTNAGPTSPRKLRIPKWLWTAATLLSVGGASWAAYRFWLTQPQAQSRRAGRTAPVQRLSTVPITVSANGTVQPTRSINVSPKTAGILKTLVVNEGDSVTQGQILATMDDANLRGQLTQARGQLASAEANLRRLLNGNRPQDIAGAQAQLASAQANLDKLIAGNRPQDIAQAQARVEEAAANLRQAEYTFGQNQDLQKQGAISERDLESARAARDTAQAQFVQAQQALALQQVGSRPEDIAQARADVEQRRQSLLLLQAGSRPEDIAQAQGQVLAAQGTVQTIQAQINDTVLRAPFSGIVTRKYADPGAFVTPTTAGSSVSSATSSSILSLAASNEIVAKVPETSINLLKLGQKVTIQADAFPEKTFAGSVSAISPQSIVEQNVTSFEVRVALPAEPQRLLRSGMNVDVQFQVGQLQNALLVPTVAIVRQSEGTGVFVLGQEGRPEFVSISVGLTLGNQTEVRSGLSEGQRILLSFPEGQRPQATMRGPSFPGLPSR